MKNDIKTEIRNETIDSPMVRIDALDENYVEPLREFFALNGCQVFINSSPRAQVTYHIIVGDLIFVKYIHDNHKISSQNAMTVIWEANEEDVKSIRSAYAKLALIDPKPITADLLEKLCNYFFTSSQRFIDLQVLPKHERVESSQTQVTTEKTPKQREHSTENIHITHQDTERIEKTISNEFSNHTIKKKTNTHMFTTTNTTKKRKIGIYIFITVFAIFLPTIIYSISLGAMLGIVYWQSVCITKPTVSCNQDPKNSMRMWATNARRVLPYIQVPLSYIHKNTIADENFVTALEKISATLSSTVEIEKIATDFSHSFFATDLSKTDTTATVVQIEKMKTQIFSLHTNLDMSYRLLEKILETPPFPLSVSSIQTKTSKGMDIIQTVRSRLQTAEQLLLLYPYIAGYKQPLRLLFLFQNSTELRPTGGFIGSVMEVIIEDGGITSMEVQDVYAIDGQLKGHVDPPDPIRTILQQEHWYLRDSNWDPNFEESAKKAMWFYEKETGKTVDGVIAVNSSLITQILTLLGAIELPDTKDSITADNFYEKSIHYTQTDFFPGSTQKKDFLGSLVKTIMSSVVDRKAISGIQAFSILDAALKNRTIQMYFTDPEAEQLSKQFVWAGSIPSKIYCTDGNIPCVFDYNAIIESNLGVNKANYYIKREDTRDIMIDESGKVTETIKRTIINTSNNQVGSGVYKNYMRWYLPSQAHITSFTIDNISVPAKPTKKNAAIVFPYGELDTTGADFSIIAVAFALEPSQKTTIAIQYEYTNSGVDDSHLFDIHVFSQKQSGIDEVPTIIRIQYPQFWKLDTTEKSMGITLANEGYLEYNSTMLEDSDIHVRFIKE